MARRLFVVLLLLAVGGVACSDGTGSPPATTAEGGPPGDDQRDPTDRAAYVEAMATGLLEQGGDPPLSRTEATCVAEATVDVIGADVLAAEGLDPDELAGEDGGAAFGLLSPEQAKVVAGAMVTCVDDALSQFAEDLADGDADRQACLEDALDAEMLTAIYASGFEGDVTPEVEEIGRALEKACPSSDGDGDGSSADAPAGDPAELRAAYVAAVQRGFEDDPDDPYQSEVNACEGEALVDTIGVDALRDAGIDPDDVDGPAFARLRDEALYLDARTVATTLIGCLVDPRVTLLELMSEGDPTVRACLDAELGQGPFDAFFILVLVGSVDDEELLELEPDGPTEDELAQIDELAAACDLF